MNRVVGGDLPASIWRDFVSRAAAARIAGRSAPTEGAAAAHRRSAPALRGRAQVLDTGTLQVAGQIVRLQGIEGEGGRKAAQLLRFLRNQEIACEAAGEAYRCRVGGEDLAEIIVAAGGARALPNASPELLAAEEQARSARLGIWRRGD